MIFSSDVALSSVHVHLEIIWTEWGRERKRERGVEGK